MSATTLKSEETPLAGLQRLTLEQMAEILDAAATTADDRAHRIHLGCKRIRSYLRLMRQPLGEERYGYENVYFRNLARPFGQLRDIEVAQQTVDALIAAEPDALSPAEIDTLRAVAKRLPVPDSEDMSKTRIAAAITAAQARFATPVDGQLDLKRAVKHLYRRHRRSFAKANKRRSTVCLHEWRKQAKYLRYALAACIELWPAAAPWRKRLKKLGDLLGVDHDLASLHDGLSTTAAASKPDAVIARRRAVVQARALKRGDRLCEAKAGAFFRRISDNQPA